ncbi:luciferase-like monooxygenase [Thermosporothrix hazakensis]|jgi:alkanesulfonate monooxygenase SsuD/methylene tetrahydromethanopterin reductase-like flavin-dependent oxidoreductase (luciferase family)|uniref:Luciferase-like monooxygenase n=2 Tax=Thermosporothrix TaxID=768650 RepID=A0A326UDQ6_THEHA|nr:LLM class flavin-dependent oxidoreductase [Thermosporothrix hazakensis]PZW35971.1 luciferase-like monooxygenase [Thermosporothrix hazakensis]BBH88440.1 hypothetical protein KTC_31910 [Thermosporothrix sp. COM3]GCE46626.1 hypothetical protein KTH_14950 [Thermosporothrix hazakensis]
MHFAINLPNFAQFSDTRALAELAREAEAAGWDGFFLWDHILYFPAGLEPPVPMADPWIALTAVALNTSRIKFGPMVTPLPRRRPWKVAREALTLDHLSQGRLILGVGLGSDRNREFEGFGEEADPKTQGAMLDEGLAILNGLWSGEPFSFEGTHYHIRDIQFAPRPLQQPRIPIWLAGFWPHPRPFRRAAAWDGVTPLSRERTLTPEDIHEIITFMQRHRQHTAPFDVMASLYIGRDERTPEIIAAYEAAGTTWLQSCFTWNHSLEEVRAHIRRGPCSA